MNKYNKRMEELNPEALYPDGFENEIIGIVMTYNRHIFLMDSDAIINKMINEDDMSFEEAQEYFDYNIKGAYVGENTPVFSLNVMD